MPLHQIPDPRRALWALIDATLADPADSHGYACGEVRFGRSIDIELQKGGAGFVVWLKPAAENTGAYRETTHFKVGHRGEPPDRQGYAVLDALVERLRTWEHCLRPADAAQLFAAVPADGAARDQWLPFYEWLAVRTGLKPASRHVAPAAVAERLLQDAHANGLRAIAAPAGGFIARFLTDHRGSDTIVYTARAEAQLAAVVDAERKMMETRDLPTPRHVRALGAALGYPPCCIDAFIPIRDRSNAEIRFNAVRNTSGAASWLLNQAIDGRVLVAYAVCRCDCAPSIAYARALFDALAKLDAQGAADLERALRGVMIVFAHGSAFRLLAEGGEAPPVYRYARCEGAGQGAIFERWNEALRQGDRIEVADDSVSISRGASEVARLAARPDEVQVRRFS